MNIYKKYCIETFDKSGNIQNLELKFKEDFNFAYDVLDEIAIKNPHKQAIVWCNTLGEEKTFTFEELSKESNKYANVLKNANISKGDRVLVILKRHYEYWLVAMALHKLGAVMIPATHMLTPKDIVHRIKSARVRAIITTSQNNVTDKVKEALKYIDKKEQPIKLWTVRDDVEQFNNLSSLAEKESDLFDRVYTRATDPLYIYFTSGTTGNPKGVIHNHTYPLTHIVTAKYWHRVRENGLHFTVAETGWAKASWGKMYGQWMLGCAVMIYDFDNFDPKQMINIINKYNVTSFCAPPTVYRYMVRKGLSYMPYLEQVTTAGEILSPEISRKFYEKTGLKIREGYGQTETSLLIGDFSLTDIPSGSMGKPSPFYNIKIYNDENKEASDGEVGEIVILPNKNNLGIFAEYLDNKEQYNHVWRDGVYHTGDSAYRDKEGFYWFYGRFDDVIKTGGYRVGPYEIENVLMEHKDVLECSVVGVADELRGSVIKAFVVLVDGVEGDKTLEKEIKDYTNNKLAEYKWIKSIELVEEMPKTISGKIKKTILRR